MSQPILLSRNDKRALAYAQTLLERTQQEAKGLRLMLTEQAAAIQQAAAVAAELATTRDTLFRTELELDAVRSLRRLAAETAQGLRTELSKALAQRDGLQHALTQTVTERDAAWRERDFEHAEGFRCQQALNRAEAQLHDRETARRRLREAKEAARSAEQRAQAAETAAGMRKAI